MLLLLVCFAGVVNSQQSPGNIACRPALSLTHREILANKFRAITGWTTLTFNKDGELRLGQDQKPIGGSASARTLLSKALSGPRLIVFEDASGRSDVVFARVVEARWTHHAANKPQANLVLIDFTDFSHVIGDEDAIAAFDEGWAVLHEIAHVVNESADAVKDDHLGECEAAINVMRRECGLAERAEYYFTYVPGKEFNAFTPRLVRLAFDLQSPETSKKRRSWIMWDAALVGGIDSSKQIAAR